LAAIDVTLTATPARQVRSHRPGPQQPILEIESLIMKARTVFLSVLVGGALIAQQQPAVRVLDAPVVAVEGFSRIDQLVDLDRDGDLDGAGLWFARTTSSSNPIYLELSLHSNDGQGRLTKSLLRQIQTTSGGQPTDYNSAIGDFDGDGYDDLFTTWGNTLCRSRPGAPLVSALAMPSFGSLNRRATLLAADIDGNGTEELVVGDTQSIQVYQLTATQIVRVGFTTTWVAAQTMALCDATGDGIAEALVLEGATLGIYSLTATVITRLSGIPLPANAYLLGSPAMTAGDVEGDGDRDIVLFGPAHYVLVERLGPTQFVSLSAVAGGPATHLFDFDSDGDLDGCCCGGGGGPTLPNPNTVLGQFEYAENIGGRTFAAAWRMPSVGPFHLAGCADMNGDGHNDLVGGRCIYFGPGTRNPLGTRPNPNGAPVVDLDEDGDPDVLDTTVNWRNAGNGSFANAALDLPALPQGQQWSVPQPGDYDVDGDVDLFAHRLGDPTSGTHLLENAGGGHFVDRGPVTGAFETFDSTLPLRLFDFDGDGDRDLIETRSIRTWIWLRNGAGNFIGTTMWLGRYVLGEGDFNGDGRVDLLAATNVTVAEQNWWDVAVLSNQGGGSYVQRPAMSMYSITEMASIDYDGDTDLDLIGWTYNGTTSLVVLENDGTGVFTVGSTLAPEVTVDEYEGRFRIADVDADGLWDIVAGPSRYPDVNRSDEIGVWVVRQSSPGVFEPTLYLAGHGELRDADGDGDLDVLGKHLATNTKYGGERKGVRHQYGAALAGVGGALPTLGATGPFRVGGTAQVRMRGGIGAGIGVLNASFADAVQPNLPLPGLTSYLGPSFPLSLLFLGGTAGAPGTGSAAFAIALPPVAQDLTFYLQAFVLETNVVPLSVTQTQGLRIHVGW